MDYALLTDHLVAEFEIYDRIFIPRVIFGQHIEEFV